MRHVALMALALILGGCGPIGAGIWLSQDDSSSNAPSNDTPLVIPGQAPARVVTGPVELPLSLSDAEGDLVNVELEFDGGAGFEAASLLSATPVAASPAGVNSLLRWDAAADLGGTAYRAGLRLRVTPRDAGGRGVAREFASPVAYGNDAPVVSSVALDAPGGTVSGNAVVRFTVSDSASDPVALETFEFSLAGDFSDAQSVPLVAGQGQPFPGGALSELVSTPSGTAHSVTWDTRLAALVDRAGVRVRLRVRDTGSVSGLAASAPFTLVTTPPAVVVSEPISNRDEDGPVELRFTLQDPEGDPADVVLQWTTASGTFPGLSDLTDAALRSRVLLDPDERARRRIVTPAPRTLVTGRCQRVLAPDLLLLTDLSPPTAVTTETWAGGLVDLLSAGGAVEQTRQIDDSGWIVPMVRVQQPFSPAPRLGQRVRVREREDRLSLSLVASPVGQNHRVTWDAPRDVGLGSIGVGYRIRGTAFGGPAAGVSTTTGFPKPLRSEGARFVGVSSTNGELDNLGDSFALGDLDGDGLLDVAQVDADTTRRVGTGHSDPAGYGASFTREPALPLPMTATSPEAVGLPDIDGDGARDVVALTVRGGSQHALALFLNNGDGSLTPAAIGTTDDLLDLAPPVQRRSQGRSHSLASGDLDGDGLLDLVTVHGASQVDVLLQRPQGGSPAFLDTPVPVSSPGALVTVALGDFDEDGALDLVAAGGGAALTLLRGNGLGDFDRFAEIATPTGGRSQSVALADLNADGHLDLIAALEDLDLIAVFLGEGNGSFGSLGSDWSTLVAAGDTPRSVAAGDFNDDGVADLAVANHRGRRLSLLFGLGDGLSFTSPSSELFPTPGQAKEVRIVDVDGDGRGDVPFADGGVGAWGHPKVYLSQGDEALVAGSPATLPNTLPRRVVVADFDEDGALDLVVAREGGASALTFQRGQGDGVFAAPVDVDGGFATGSYVSTGDLNEDGHLDLVLSLGENAISSVRVLFGNGDGTFANVFALSGLEGRAFGSAIGDVDDDGRPDVVVASYDGQPGVSVFLGPILSARAAPDARLIAPGAVTVALHDVNSDGCLDVISADRTANRLGVFLGPILGDRMMPQPAVTTQPGPQAITAGDFDEDGFLDLASANIDSNTLSIAFGDGNGSFPRNATLEPGRRPYALCTYDLNGDGHQDLIGASDDPGSGTLFVLFGRGDGSFRWSAAGPILVGDGPQSVAVADLNGDGRLDLVAAIRYENHLAVHLGGSRGTFEGGVHGTPRAQQPTSGTGAGGSLVLRPGPHRIDTSGGTIDGVVPLDAQGQPAFAGGSFHFSSFTIPAGATVVVTGRRPLALLATGSVTIEGTLICSGQDALDCTQTPNRNAGGNGGQGGPGGAAGGAGGGSPPGARRLRGHRGAGSGGGRVAWTGPASAGGGGFATAGAAVAAVSSGGTSYGNPEMQPIYGGSGGGGGSAQDGDGSGLSHGDCGGGGGGGGGGAVRITAGGPIVVSGTIRADGGGGGRGNPDGMGRGGGHGGGGSGGAILLQSYDGITISGTLSAVGGPGAVPDPAASPPDGRLAGGDGGGGRIRLESTGSIVTAGAALAPSPVQGGLP